MRGGSPSGPQRPGGAFPGNPGRIQAGTPPNAALGAPQARSANYGNQLQSMMSGLNRRQFAGGGAVKAALKKHRLLVDGKIINPGDVVTASDGEELVFKMVSRQNEQLTGGNSGGKIVVESVEERRIADAMEEFWDTYTEGDPEDGLAQFLKNKMDPEDFAELHEAYEMDSEPRMLRLRERYRVGSREYYPTVVNGEIGPPPIERIKARGGRINLAGGGSIKKALTALKKARFELEEGSDPDIDLIARSMEADDYLASLGRRIRANEKKVEKMSIEDAEKYYQRISRLLDEAEEGMRLAEKAETPPITELDLEE